MALDPITVYPIPATFVAQKLNTYSDMADVLAYLIGLGEGYTGNISAAGPDDWTLWFQGANQNASWNAKLGHWVVVKNGKIASAFSDATAIANYTANPPA